MQDPDTFLADLPAVEPKPAIFKPTETWGALRRTAARIDTVMVALSVRTTLAILYLDTDRSSFTLGFEPDQARALAAELVASAELLERGVQ